MHKQIQYSINPQHQQEFTDQCYFRTADVSIQNQQFLKLLPYDEKYKYRCVSNGFNIKGSCRNASCVAFQKDVWIIKGYDTFDFAKATVDNICPSCSTKMNSKSFKNFGYRNAHVELYGSKINPITQQDVKISYKHTTKQNLLTTYFEKDENMVEWSYLTIKVEPIKK